MTHLEHIRRKPGMYFGRLEDGAGILRMIWQLLATEIEEDLAGRCSRIAVEVAADGSISVEDDGPGIPLEEVDRVARALTSLHETAMSEEPTRHGPFGRRGVGLFTVCAFSAWLELRVRREGRQFAQRFEHGVAVSERRDDGAAEATGTRLAFLPEPEFFSGWFNSNRVLERLRELGYLVPGLAFHFADRREHRFHEPRGLVAQVAAGVGAQGAGGPAFLVAETSGGMLVEVAAQWRPFGWASIESFVNLQRTTEGGTHVRSFRLGLAAGFKQAAPEACAQQTPKQIERALGWGLVATVCLRAGDPRFAGSTRDCLVTPAAQRAARKCVATAFRAFLEREPAMLKRFVERCARGELA
jgi:DNA gyrase subunit B